MVTDDLSLRPAQTSNSSPNFADATGDVTFDKYSQNPSGTLTDAQIETLVKGGVASAIAEGQATFSNDPVFSTLVTKASVIGEEGAFEGSAKIDTQAIANFSVAANRSLSLNFSADLALKAKEIENPDTEFNKAESVIAFLVLDTADVAHPRIVDYFGIWGRLVASEQSGDLIFSASNKVLLTDKSKAIDVNGNNGTDFVTGNVTGTFQSQFHRDTNLTLVEINTSAVKFSEDTFIGNLGEDFIYGTIRDDRLEGTQGADKLYGSLGNDSISGKQGDDLLEGGPDNDTLIGNDGVDRFSYRTFLGSIS
jgi:serralysin